MTQLQSIGDIAPALRGGAMSVGGIAVGLAISIVLSCAGGCADESGERGIAKREFMPFQREVYPVLLRDCGFPECHGAPERAFRVWGPGRSRLPREMIIPEALDLPTGDEVAGTYSLAQSMIDDEDPASSLLLRKPLAVEAGGAGHLGVDKYGRNVYRTAQDTGYLSLARWVMSQPPPPRTP